MEKTDEGKIVTNRWIKKLGITRPQFHSGEFNGNMCKRLLTNLDALYQIVMEEDAPQLVCYITAFKSFNNVRTACFGMDLLPHFAESIAEFEQKYLCLQISVTPAVHVLLCHVVQFCRFFKCSLGKFSEQASESVHRDFKDLWESSGKVDPFHKNYEKNLYLTVLRYNGRHLGL